MFLHILRVCSTTRRLFSTHCIKQSKMAAKIPTKTLSDGNVIPLVGESRYNV